MNKPSIYTPSPLNPVQRDQPQVPVTADVAVSATQHRNAPLSRVLPIIAGWSILYAGAIIVFAKGFQNVFMISSG